MYTPHIIPDKIQYSMSLYIYTNTLKNVYNTITLPCAQGLDVCELEGCQCFSPTNRQSYNGPANLCPCEIGSLCVFGVRSHPVHRAMVLLRVSTVVAFCAALIGGGAVGAKAEVTASVPAGVHWRASPPEGMPLWGPNRFCLGSGLGLRCPGPGFTVLALGSGFRPIIINVSVCRYSCVQFFISYCIY